MDPPTEILQRVDHDASSTDGKTPPPPPPQHAGTAADAAVALGHADGEKTPPQAVSPDAVSKVLDNDDLLLEIMLCLGLPTSLVRAILVCKRWFFLASAPSFLRRFRRQHPPHLLGFYVATRSTTSLKLLRPRFIPMPPPPQPDQLAAAVGMAEGYSRLDAYDGDFFTCVYDLQNDTMLVSGFYGDRTCAIEVHWPMMSPHRAPLALPVTPQDQMDGTACTAAHFLLKDETGHNRLVYVWLTMGFIEEEKGRSMKYKAHIYVLQEEDGRRWRFHSSAAAVLPSPRPDTRPLLVGTRIYLEHATSILALDLKTSSFSTIPLPGGMERYDCKATMLAPAYDLGIFLVHLDENLQLRIWLRTLLNWLLVDVVSLPPMFETVGMTGWTPDGEPATLLHTTQMGDLVEFVFLKLGQCALCFDTRRRVLRKVYGVTQEDQTLERIHPFMMTWPPNFPTLKGDHLARNVS